MMNIFVLSHGSLGGQPSRPGVAGTAESRWLIVLGHTPALPCCLLHIFFLFIFWSSGWSWSVSYSASVWDSVWTTASAPTICPVPAPIPDPAPAPGPTLFTAPASTPASTPDPTPALAPQTTVPWHSRAVQEQGLIECFWSVLVKAARLSSVFLFSWLNFKLVKCLGKNLDDIAANVQDVVTLRKSH